MSGQSLQDAFVPLPAGATAVYNSSELAYYRHPGWLSSSRLASTPSRGIHFDTAYGPFGESYAQSGTTDLSFTGQNQDTVPALYDFYFREYGIQGRWPSPDPAGLAAVDPADARSWNRYAYVLNDPLALVDPLGLDTCKDENGNSASCIKVTARGGGGDGDIHFEDVGPGQCVYVYKNGLPWFTTCGFIGPEGRPTFDRDHGSDGANGGVRDTRPSCFSVLLGSFREAYSSIPGIPVVSGPKGSNPEDAAKAAVSAAATRYTVARGLVVPLRSWVIRGLTVAETGVELLPVIQASYALFVADIKEAKAKFWDRTCK